MARRAAEDAVDAMDTNKDGGVSVEEAMANLPAMQTYYQEMGMVDENHGIFMDPNSEGDCCLERDITALDEDKDGKVTAEEYATWRAPYFEP